VLFARKRLPLLTDDDGMLGSAKRTIMETPGKQAPISCRDLVMRIRKLRWVGLEEKAEQLEKELEQCAVTDRVGPIQIDTDEYRCRDRLAEGAATRVDTAVQRRKGAPVDAD
jgi:hypothetical protein